jgi:hypothetical protein
VGVFVCKNNKKGNTDMIRLKFKAQCRDGKTRALYAPGDVVDFEDERAEEILAVSDGKYAARVEEPQKPKKEPDKGDEGANQAPPATAPPDPPRDPPAGSDAPVQDPPQELASEPPKPKTSKKTV